MLDRFNKYIKENNLIKPSDTILLAVSGGIDSMVMLDLFLRTDHKIAIAHCNFTLRGAESDADQALVENTAKRNNIPIFAIKFDTKKEAIDRSESIQMAARRLRYEWFEKLRNEHQFDKIATAHHSDDSTETFFINLIRGTGLRGLTGINRSNGATIRPILFASREIIIEYARQRNVAFRNDATNSDKKYLRNYIRHSILPALEAISPSFMNTMTNNMHRLEQTQEFVDNHVDTICGEIFDGKIIDLNIVEQSGNTNFVLFELLHPYGFAPEVIEDITFSLNNSGRRFLAPAYVATIDRQKIILEPRTERREYQIFEIKKNDPRIEWLDKNDITNLETQPNVALLSADNIEFPLTVRHWEQGDSFMPLGMTGHKKVSDYLIDTKIPLPEKEHQTILLTNDDVPLWLVGRRIDDRFKITDDTKKIIKITL